MLNNSADNVIPMEEEKLTSIFSTLIKAEHEVISAKNKIKSIDRYNY